MKKGIHHCQPQCSQPALQQIPNHTAGLLWTQKSPRFPREVIRRLQGRLQGWFAKAKPEGSQNRTPLPPPGCKGAKAVAPALKGREIFFGQGKPELAALPPSWPFPEASLLCPPCLSFSQGFSLKSPSLFLSIGLRLSKPHF